MMHKTIDEMNYKSLLPVALCLLVINACSKSDKNDNKNPTSASYQSGNTLIIDQLALYTSSGIHTDVALIQGYLDRYVGNADFREWFYVGQKTVKDPFIGKELVLIDDKKAELNMKPMEIILRNDTLLLLAAMDSTDVPSKSDIRCEQLPGFVPAITAATYCPAGSCKKYRKTYPIMISGGDFYLPTLYYHSTHSEWIVRNGIQGIQWCSRMSQDYPELNFLNKNLSDSLRSMDTVLVQVGRVKMTKR
jgi:hypothetical protein